MKTPEKFEFSDPCLEELARIAEKVNAMFDDCLGLGLNEIIEISQRVNVVSAKMHKEMRGTIDMMALDVTTRLFMTFLVKRIKKMEEK